MKSQSIEVSTKENSGKLELPIHPRQRLRIQRSLNKKKSLKEGTEDKQKTKKLDPDIQTDEDEWEDAMDEEAIERLERTKLWNPQVWDSAISGNISNLLVLAARGWRCDIPHPRSGITPLWAAAEYGKEEVVTFLLDSMEVNINARADDGSTPLFAAAQNGHFNVMVLLLSNRSDQADVNLARTSDGATPLYVACQRAHLSCIRLLLSKGADPNKKRKGGYTPLWTACDRGHQGVIDILISDVKCDLSLPNDQGIKPASAAKRAGHRNLARYIELMAKNQISKNSTTIPTDITSSDGKDNIIDVAAATLHNEKRNTAVAFSSKISLIESHDIPDTSTSDTIESGRARSRPRLTDTEKEHDSGDGDDVVVVDDDDDGVGNNSVDDDAYSAFVDKQVVLDSTKKLHEDNKGLKVMDVDLKHVISNNEEASPTTTTVEGGTPPKTGEAVMPEQEDKNSIGPNIKVSINKDVVEATIAPVSLPTKAERTRVKESQQAQVSLPPIFSKRVVGPGEESLGHSLFVYADELKKTRDWSWEAYIRQSAFYTHNICRCVQASYSSCEAENDKFDDTRRHSSSLRVVDKCGWRKRVSQLTGLSDGFSRPQVSPGLFEQVEKLHSFVAMKSQITTPLVSKMNDDSNEIVTQLVTEGQSMNDPSPFSTSSTSRLCLTQCLFTEGRGLETQRVHTLELRIGCMRPKRLKEGNWRRYEDPCLVSSNEVVLLLGIPLRFPQDARVRIHCMQGFSRIPPDLVRRVGKVNSKEQEEGNSLKKRNKMKSSSPPALDSVESFDKDDKEGIAPFRPGDVINFTWMNETTWTQHNHQEGSEEDEVYSLVQFAQDLFHHIEAKGGQYGGLLPPKRAVFDASYADALLLKNEKAAAQSEASRLARLSAPLQQKDKRARLLAAFGLAVQIALFFVLMALKNRGL